MPEFPEAPLAPTDFLESWFPEAFAAAELPPEAREVDVKLGIQLHGDEGGEWIYHMQRGALHVLPGSRDEAGFSYVQSVVDWRAALWGQGGGPMGKAAAQLFRPGSAPEAAQQMPGVAPLAALEELSKLEGLIQLVVGTEADLWSVGLKFGPGEIPTDPTTKVSISSEDAAAMETGELDPMTAFMSGKIRVEGDMTLMMQMQAIAMQAAQAQGGSTA